VQSALLNTNPLRIGSQACVKLEHEGATTHHATDFWCSKLFAFNLHLQTIAHGFRGDAADLSFGQRLASEERENRAAEQDSY
jgi:hypothetical protein